MTFRNFSAPLVLLLAVGLMTTQVIAQEEEEGLLDRAKDEARETARDLLADDDEADAEDAMAESGEMPEMNPEMAAMMEAWQQANTPGEEHARLAWFEGDWTTETSHWMAPDAEPMTAPGTSSMKMIFDGRFLHDHFESEWMDQAFSGMGFTGFDNTSGQYVSYWFDSMSTSAFTSQGRFDPDANQYEYHGEYANPMDPENSISVRYTITIDSDEQFTFSMFEDRGGAEMKTMEIVYTRAQ